MGVTSVTKKARAEINADTATRLPCLQCKVSQFD